MCTSNVIGRLNVYSNTTSMCAIILIDHLKKNSNVIGHLNDNSNVIGPINGNSNVIGPLNLCVMILYYVMLNHAYCT